MNDTVRYILRLCLFALVQVVLFNTIDISTYVYVCPSVLFLMLFPFTTSTISLLLWAFGLGMVLDLWGGGLLGLQTAALLTVAFVRNTLLKLVAAKGEFGQGDVPNMAKLGFERYLLFTCLSVLVHHLVFFNLEHFSVSLLLQLTIRISASFVVNVLLILLFERTFYAKKS